MLTPTLYPARGIGLSGTAHRPFRLHEVCTGFAGRRDVLSTRSFQDIFGQGRPLGVVAVNRQQDATVFDASLVSLRLVLGNSHPDQRPRETTHGSAHSDAS